jgi:UDP-2-acetamido-3-amino-2,3-dideoxy-glucuronate N-acetyltransferase
LPNNVVVVGTGYWGKNLVRNFYELKALLGICDINPATLSTFKTKYPNTRAYADFTAVLNDSDVKAVVIATPAASHYALVKESLESGKDVFVEKPLALKYDEGKELVALAESREKILMVGHILQYHPAIIRMKELITKGEIGKIHYIYSNRLNLGKIRTEENILWSFAPHDISVILHLIGESPVRISAHGGNYISDNIADITVTTLDFPSGTKAHIFVSWLHPYKEQKLVIIGEKMMLFDDMNPDQKLFIYSHKIDWINGRPLTQAAQAVAVPIEKREPLKAECSHFIDCLASRTTPKTDGREGLRVLQVLETSQNCLKSK